MHERKDPLTPQQWELLRQLTTGLSTQQLIWVSGYLAGIANTQDNVAHLAPAYAAQPSLDTTILFGSQTGNAEKIAHRLQTRLQEKGIPARVESMGRYKSAQLKREHRLLVVISTHGEGDPPDTAVLFHEFLHGKKAPQLESLQFSVLGLGDISYEHFCKTGKDFDSRLEALGATRIHARVDCDVDYEESAENWIEAVAAKLTRSGIAPGDILPPATAQETPVYTKSCPFPATLLENLTLTGRGSTKEVRHIELSIENSGLTYEPGDALGLLPSHEPKQVEALLAALQLDPESAVRAKNGSETLLGEALRRDYEITTLTRPFLEKYAEMAESRELNELLAADNRQVLREFIHGREIIDVIRRFPVTGISAEQFVALLRKLPPRLYSIASSYRANPDEVHLTVGVVRYESHGLRRQGVASTFLAERVEEGAAVPVYVEKNPNFRLPRDPDKPIIMVGPGTGIAPFRAFLAEREIMAAKGRNWLFFGDRHFHSDFLYQREWLDYRANGLLNRIDVAFSRDEDEKVYVQHRLMERSRDIFAWLEEGAHIYVCGDAERMAPDVHETLIALVAKEAGLSRERAESYVRELQNTERYQRDVY